MSTGTMKAGNIAIVLLLATVVIAAGCRAAKAKGDIVAYAEDPDNGLHKKVQLNGMTYDIQYRPRTYTLAMEHLAQGDAAADKRMKELEGTVWFNISFSVDGSNQSPLRYKVSGLEEYTQRQDYFLNQARNDISINYKGRDIKPMAYWFENNQNLSPKETIIAGFELPPGEAVPDDNIDVLFRDQVFRNGIIRTVITKEDLGPVAPL